MPTGLYESESSGTTSTSLVPRYTNSLTKMHKVLLFLTVLFGTVDDVFMDDSFQQSPELYTIEGKVYSPDNLMPSSSLDNWQIHTRIMVNGGEFKGFLRKGAGEDLQDLIGHFCVEHTLKKELWRCQEVKKLPNGLKHLLETEGTLKDGNFVVTNVPSGSYLVEAVNPDFAYEPVRVEINSKGKFRARKVNFVQTSKVVQMPYPLKMKPLARFKYFQIREQWRATDFLFSPMIYMMVLPFLLIMILPKVMNDPEARKDMEMLNNSMKYDMPEMSEVITSFFSGGEKPKLKNAKSSKKKV